MRLPRLAAALAIAGSGCVTLLEQHDSPVGELTDDCAVPVPAGLAALDAPVSLEYPDRSLWLWERLPRAGGGDAVGVAAWATSAAAVCRDGPAVITDGAGAPVELLALSAAEQAANATRTDGKRLALVPTGGVVEAGVGYLYYDHVLRGPGLFDAEPLGTGLCTLAAGATTCARVATAGGDTVLWRPDRRVLDRGGVIIDEPGGRRALLPGCRHVAAFEDPCVMAGVPVAALTDPAAYQVYDVFHGWVDALTDATTIGDSAGQLTLTPLDGRMAAVTVDIFASTLAVRLADDPRGGYGRPIAALALLPPAAQWFVSGGRVHEALRAGDDAIAVSYATDNRAAPGLHLIGFRFYGGLE